MIKKKIFGALTLTSAIAALIISGGPVYAYSITQSASPSSTYTGGTIRITISDTYDYVSKTAPANGTKCGNYLVQLSGSSNKLNGVTYANKTSNNSAGDWTSPASSAQTYYSSSLPKRTDPSYGSPWIDYSCTGSYTVSTSVAQTETATLWGGGKNVAPIAASAVSISFAAKSAPSSSTSSGSSQTPQTSTTTHTASKPAPKPVHTIKLSKSGGLTLWKGANFGMKGQNLSGSDSSKASVGIATKQDIPLATVTVNLSKARDWSKAKLGYGSDKDAHKAFVHGLTSAPGVVGHTFTLYVPYQAGDKYIGICPGAASFTDVGAACPDLYYLQDGQKKTNKDVAGIPAKVTVKASIVTIEKTKYWMVSGLTGTGGFSSTSIASNPRAEAAAQTTVTPAKASSKSKYAIGALVIIVLLVAATYKLWIGKIRGGPTRGSDDPGAQQPPAPQPPSARPPTLE